MRQIGRHKVGKGVEEYRDNPEGRVRAMGRLRASLAKLIGLKRTDPPHTALIDAHYKKYDELLEKNGAILEMMAGAGWRDLTQSMRDTLAQDGRELPNQVLTMTASGDCQALVTAVRILMHRKFLGVADSVVREQGKNVARSQEQFRAALKEQGD